MKSSIPYLMLASASIASALVPATWTPRKEGPEGFPHGSPNGSNFGDVQLPLKPHPVYFFPGKSNKIETLFPRPNGRFLVSSAIPARMYQMDPTNSTPPTLVYEFPGGQHADLLGIAGGEPDVYYTATVRFTKPFDFVPHSFVVYRVDMNTFATNAAGEVTRNATVTKFTDIPEAGTLNGFTSVYNTQQPPSFFLAGDSQLGLLWKFDIASKSYQVAGNHSTFKPTGKGFETSLGINGLKIQDGHLYYTNSGAGIMYRLPISDEGIVDSTAEAQVIATDIVADDFCIDAATKYAYVAGTNNTNVVYRVDLDTGKFDIFGGVYNSNSSILRNPTAVQFGRTPDDSRSVYVSVDGGNPIAVNGTQGLVRFDVDDFARPFVY